MPKFWVTPIAAVFFLCAPSAEAGVIVPIPSVPGSSYMTVEGINDSNQIAGYYNTPDGAYHGFVGDLNGNYTTFDAGPGGSVVHGLNNAGDVTGTAYDKVGDFIGKAFVRTPGGIIKLITKDGASFDGYADGITNKTVFVGARYQLTDKLYEFGYYGKGRAYTADLTVPFNTYQTRPRGINKHGEVAGFFLDMDHAVNESIPDSGFVLKDGVAARVIYPDADAFNTFLFGLNDRGAIVGSWLNTAQTAEHGFLYNFEKNRFKLLDVPGHSFSEALAINHAGLVTITTEDNSYLYCPEKRTCPLDSESAKDIPDRWISAAKLSHRVPCENACIGSPHKSLALQNPTADRAAIARGV